jgi:transposase
MTKQSRRKFSSDFKARVALEAIKNQKTLAELSQQFEVHSVTISKWKTEFLENMSIIFENGHDKKDNQDSPEREQLYAQIGQLKVENDFLKKSARKLGISDTAWK